MEVSRRDALKGGVALAAVPLARTLSGLSASELYFPTGQADIDRTLGGGMRLGTLLVVAGPRASGKSEFILRLGKANGIMDAHPMNQGTSDQLSIVQRPDRSFIGSLMLNAGEPSTDLERRAMDSGDQAVADVARNAFLTRWLRRTKEVLQESGGIFALSVCEDVAPKAAANWFSIPDYLIKALGGGTYKVIPREARSDGVKPS